MLRYFSLLILIVVFGISCSCSSVPPPAVLSPPPHVPLLIPYYVCKSQGPCGPDYKSVPWNEWQNPRLIVMSDGIKVLLPHTSKGMTVPVRWVVNVLFANTTENEWPLGRVVFVKISELSGHPEMLENDRSKLLRAVRHSGIDIVMDDALPGD